MPNATVDLVDLSADALAVAQQNVERQGLEQEVNLIQSDCLDALTAAQQYDIIVSNPPYVGGEEMASLPDEYHQEPAMALAAGEDGLDIVRRILKEAAGYLKPEGVLICEVGNSDLTLQEAFPEVPFLWLEFERGGHGVFAMTKRELEENQSFFEK